MTHAVSFLRQWNFDGLDIDYEYPVDVGGVQTDKVGFTELLRELKEAMEPRGLKLTVAVAADPKKVDAGYEVAKISELVDAVHLMTYDMYGSWESNVDHHAPLRGNDKLTVDQALVFLLDIQKALII